MCSGDTEKVPKKCTLDSSPNVQIPLLQDPPFSAFHLQPPDLATVRMDMSVMFRVKAEAVPSCRIQSVRRPVKNGMAISPGEEEEGGISHKYQISLSRSVPSRLPSLPHPTLSNPHSILEGAGSKRTLRTQLCT